MGLVKSPKECLVCLNSIETVFVPNEESQKIFNICCSYVKGAINVEFLINNIIGNNDKLSICKNCLGCSLIISQHVEQITKLKKEINDLSSSFLETIEKQRIKAKSTKDANKSQFSKNINTKHIKSNNPGEDSIEDSESDSFIHLEASSQLIVDHIGADEISSENVKTESDGIFLEYEDESCTANVSGYNEEEYETNYLVTEDENEVDPFREIDLDQTYGIANDCNYTDESNPQNGAPESLAESVSSVTMPNIVFKRNKRDIFKTKSSYQDKPGVTFKKNLRGCSSRNCNSTNKLTNLKSKKSKRRQKLSLHICSICQKGFCASADLKRHYVTHTGEKPYKCTVCEKAYTQSGDLKIHERLHTGERPYKCSLCDRAFIRLKTLKSHEKTHTNVNVKPYNHIVKRRLGCIPII